MSDSNSETSARLDRSEHLSAVHGRWATPMSVITETIGEVSKATIQDVRRIVAGEQNEVYDVTLERTQSLIVRISHKGSEGHEREAWVLDQCARRGILAPRVHTLRRVEVGGGWRSIIVMDKLPGERLSDIDLAEADGRRVLGEIGEWLRALHSIPAEGFGYINGSGVGFMPSLDEWLTGSVVTPAPVFEEAGRSVGLEPATVRGWIAEIVDAFRSVPPRVSLIHNDLLANHVLVHNGRLSGIIDFGEVASEPAAVDFARWDFNEGDRLPVEWIQAGYGDDSLFEAPHDRTYRALKLATGLWLMQWYHGTGFPAGVAAARDRLVNESGR